MAKTEVILTHNVVGLGAESDQVKVAAGYARNYLFPQGLAIPLTGANKRRLEALRKRRQEREGHELTTMTELSQGLSKLTLVIAVKSGEDGKMFGSVTAGTIADELKHQFEAVVDKRKIHLPQPIKRLGSHEVELRLHPEVVTTLKVRVDSTTPTGKPVEAPAPVVKQSAPSKPAPKDKDKAEVTKDRPERKPRPAKTEQA
jgi:large subunit ribosomal protein L9